MSLAPEHAPTMARQSLLQRLEPHAPALLIAALALAGLALIPALSSWITLTVAGLAMGMMIFTIASGMTLVFGLLDVINFGHGAFISVGAFVGVSALAALGGGAPDADPSALSDLTTLALAAIAAMAATALMGLAFERVIVRPVYGAHLKQILVTMGGLIIVQQLIFVVWGPDEIHVARPESLKGAWTFAGAAVEKYRVMAVGLGLALFLGLRWLMRGTKVGLLVRAGVENGEMVEALGYDIRRLFIAVFMAGSALAGLGGVMWGLYQEVITAHMGGDIMVMVFIVVIIGGLGSVEGCFIGALLIGLLYNYVAFLAPKAALVSNIGLMVAILMWRPQGMFPVVKAK
ncbi:amino acid/amide ABC transporter membrane protein 1, HAAT family [Albimonas donghaensis]|uniref:Amino acid/amide ABC transporter membrane protein 1, HAAT family n=1 Tax=Albimonas donghaensis TaxID=356660 RepID=A0A1H3F230_9RHOB|nr:branched-chain amino acid ABC transporter permease [Albimonas donghaensis]SDX84279.1 amino acid/amide ABC transporter membrane protein 1, HAAT family [Albimonas donghaensis]